MKYVWSRHAASERLPERSGLTIAEVERCLDQRKYVVLRENQAGAQEHHLVWDRVKRCLIDVPVIQDQQEAAFIPSVLPVDYGSGFPEWQCAEAEQVWRGEDYYQDSRAVASERLCWADVFLTKTWVKRSGWRGSEDLFSILSWPIFDPEIARTGHEGVVALFRERAFRTTVRTLLQQWEKDPPTLVDGDILAVHIKKPGAHRIVPFSFFLLTP